MKENAPLFTQLDVTQGTQPASPSNVQGSDDERTFLMRQILAAQDRQNELMEEMISQMQNAQKQRAGELGQWKQANPELARNCRLAAEALSRVQTEFLANLTDEVNENAEHLMDGEFMLNEFVDRFGPRLAHLNGVLQMLTQLGSAAVEPSKKT